MTNVQSENIRCRFASFFPSLPRSISLETIAPVRCCMHTVCILFVQICKYSYGRASVIHKSVNRWVYYVAYVNFHWTNFQYVNVWHHHNMLESSHVSFASPSDWRVTLLQKGWAYVSTEMVKAMSKWCQTSAQVWFLNVFCLLKYSTVTYIQTLGCNQHPKKCCDYRPQCISIVRKVSGKMRVSCYWSSLVKGHLLVSDECLLLGNGGHQEVWDVV